MSGVVHFKFGHAHGFDRLNFEGHFISVGDLKRLITEKRQLGTGPAGALALADPETGTEYLDDGHLLRRNAAVIVKRVPLRAPGAAAVIESAPEPASTTAAAAPGAAGGASVGGTSEEAARKAEEEFGGDLFAAGGEDGLDGGGDGDGDRDDLAALVAQTADTWAREVAAGRGRGRGRPMANENFVGRGQGRGERDPGAPPPRGTCAPPATRQGTGSRTAPPTGTPPSTSPERGRPSASRWSGSPLSRRGDSCCPTVQWAWPWRTTRRSSVRRP